MQRFAIWKKRSKRSRDSFASARNVPQRRKNERNTDAAREGASGGKKPGRASDGRAGSAAGIVAMFASANQRGHRDPRRSSRTNRRIRRIDDGYGLNRHDHGGSLPAHS